MLARSKSGMQRTKGGATRHNAAEPAGNPQVDVSLGAGAEVSPTPPSIVCAESQRTIKKR